MTAYLCLDLALDRNSVVHGLKNSDRTERRMLGSDRLKLDGAGMQV